MSDPEALFAHRLGIAFRVWDWWRLKGQHTPWEWALQKAAERVQPFGERRADMRAAENTGALVNALAKVEIDLDAMYSRLCNYLPVDQVEEKTLFPDEIPGARTQ